MIDAHVHLDDDKFDGIREEIIANFKADNINYCVNCASDYQTTLSSLALATKYQEIYCALGCHPHDAKTYDKSFENKIIELANNPKVVAIGEIGLDYYYELSDKITQKEVFIRQILLADQLKLPIVLHIREAYQDALDILTQYKGNLNNGVMFHCFSGSAEIASQLVKLGYYFSFGGVITFAKHKPEVIKQIPLTQILTETDAPYLAPIPFRGKLNQPKYISYVLPILSQAYQLTSSQLETQLEQNLKILFKKIK
ncbi:MAG: TatD family hydrolase [Clostridia bacterium]